MREMFLTVPTAALLLALAAWPAGAQTATATSPSQSSSGSGGNAAPIGPSGGTASPQRMANKPALGGNTQQDVEEEHKNDKRTTICKGC